MSPLEREILECLEYRRFSSHRTESDAGRSVGWQIGAESQDIRCPSL